MKRILFFVFTLFSCIVTAQSTLDSIYQELDDVMLAKEQFDSEKEERIKSLKSLLIYKDKDNIDASAYQINNKLITEYWSYSFDSTIVYINKNKELGNRLNNDKWLHKSKLDLALLLASSGIYKEAEDILTTIHKEHLSPSLLKEYYSCYKKIYSDLDYFALQHEYKEEYFKLYNAYTDSIAPLIKDTEDEYLYLQEWDLLDLQKFEECLAINSKRLSKAKVATKEYSYITFQRSMIYEQMNDREQEKKYLALSAISDIKASRKDNAALAKLALRIYEDGDIERAFTYIKYSFEDAIFFNSKLRFVEIANSFSLIMEAHQIESDKRRKALIIFTVVVSVLSLILFLLLYFVYKQKKTLQEAKIELAEINKQYKALNISLEQTMEELKLSYQDLSEANKIKELYIGNFMKICSDFIDKLDKYRVNVNKMVRNKKYQQLFDMTKTQQAIENEVAIFYNKFDETFLTLYPSFVDDVNNLLHDDEKIELKSNEVLNAELRILAVIRLGINESARIAELLRYSVNTIYNYRAKVKNRAKNREDFEHQILKIGSYD